MAHSLVLREKHMETHSDIQDLMNLLSVSIGSAYFRLNKLIVHFLFGEL